MNNQELARLLRDAADKLDPPAAPRPGLGTALEFSRLGDSEAERIAKAIAHERRENEIANSYRGFECN